MEIKDESYPPVKTPRIEMESTPIEHSTAIGANGAFSWAGFTAKFALLIALLTAGFTFGTHVAEAKAHETMASLQADNTVKSAELEKNRAELSTWSSAYRTLQERLGQKETQITQLTDAVGRGRSCDFLRQQIESTKRDLLHEQYPMAREFDRAASDQRDKETITRLETRLNNYITQFTSCTRDGV